VTGVSLATWRRRSSADKLESFRKIINSLASCAIPMLSVFVILGILVSICELAIGLLCPPSLPHGKAREGRGGRGDPQMYLYLAPTDVNADDTQSISPIASL
jgi:hypothetical protein